MDKKSKILIAVFIIFIIIAVVITYWRIMVKNDYVIESQIDCDPLEEECFVYLCDPEWDECTGDPLEDTWYYKIARRNASNIPLCDPEEDETCDPWTCELEEAECEEILCDEETAAEMKTECTDPETFAENNPEYLEFIEEECDPETDEQCIIEEEERENGTSEVTEE